MPVWKSAFNLLLKIYQITQNFPNEEKFGLTSDIRRSANSIVHNIAEGFGRFENKDKTRFYIISRGSAYELVSQVLVASELSYLNNETLKDEVIEKAKSIIGELGAMIKSIES
ncbi:four helix bundle protein [candidate division KSB1 bacterium]